MAPTGNGIKLPFKISDFLHGASSLVSVVVVLIGLVVWSAKQEGRIGELEHRINNDEEKVADLDRRGTREMAEKTGILHEHVETLKATNAEILKRVDQINSAGSQAGLILGERVGNDERQAALTRERVQSLDKVLAEMALLTQKLSARVDVLDAEVNHLRRNGLLRLPDPSPH